MNRKHCHSLVALVLLSGSFIVFVSARAASNCPNHIKITENGSSDTFLWILPDGRVGVGRRPYGTPSDQHSLDTLKEIIPREFGEGPTLAWVRCQLAAGKGGSLSANAGAPSTKAEHIPNCPPTLPPSCVTWSLYDQQLQWWSLTNNCGRDVSVSFRSEGALENTQTFGNGESYRAKWRGSNPPKQIVWDAAKGVGFYRNKPAGAALKCQAALPL